MIDIRYHGAVVAFDLDDTLLRERDFCRSGFRHIIRRFLPEQEGKELFDEMNEALVNCGNPFNVFAERLYTPHLHGDDREKWVREIIEEYRDHRPEHLSFAEGASTLLDGLKKRGIKMALVTDGRSNTQRRKIEAMGLSEYMADDCIYISEEMGEDKLSPKSFIEIVRKFPEAREFYYIGNNERKDFMQPNLLGWNTIKVRRHPDDVHPDYVNPDPIGRPGTVVASLDEIKIE